MTRIVVLMSAAVLAGCGNVRSNAAADDDGDGNGCVADAECGESETCNGDTGLCEVPDGLAIKLIPTTFFDERGDQITFSTGEPVHTHAGAAVTLGAGDCPAIYKYSYLLGPVAPAYGKESTTNPIAWKFRGIGGAVKEAEFRVRTIEATEIDWTSALAADDGTFDVVLHRSGRNGFEKLEREPRQYFVDFRVRDDQHREAVRSACWEHHPLSAPVSITGLVMSSEDDALKNMSVADEDGWYISSLMSGEWPVGVMEARLVNQTAEPVSVRLDIPEPVIEYSTTYLTDWFASSGTPGSLDCGQTCASSSPTCVEREPQDPRCREADPRVITTGAGTVTTGEWTIAVRDPSSGHEVDACIVDASGAGVTCELPGRLQDRPARELLVITRVKHIADLKPYLDARMGGQSLRNGERTWSFSAAVDVDEYFDGCIDMFNSSPSPNGEITHVCRSYGILSKFVGLYHMGLDIAAPTMTVMTRNGGVLTTPPYHPTGQIAGERFIWDSGYESLPGMN